MILPIITVDSPNAEILLKPSENVSHISLIKNLMLDLDETMYAKGGIGLAAPQVGFNLNAFVASIEGRSRYFINPTIVSKSEPHDTVVESCLSIPHYNVPVTRSTTVMVNFCNELGEQKMELFTGMPARIIQHEYDHLRGKLIGSPLYEDRIRKNIKGRIQVNS